MKYSCEFCEYEGKETEFLEGECPACCSDLETGVVSPDSIPKVFHYTVLKNKKGPAVIAPKLSHDTDLYLCDEKCLQFNVREPFPSYGVYGFGTCMCETNPEFANVTSGKSVCNEHIRRGRAVVLKRGSTC